ncbi:MAG TPA: 50S ribosomal protein L23 [Rhodospirillales bacterium]|jgi:large subunit ribosomal protein L23|nr:50S ribosomal protein L23 [Rhodospirillales bacterium]MDP7425586.1 50S ribosomal protein L23 [Rhodospirillales bacterium]MDP7625070.1 50S ribosomal protein L23 [Rhodospirillales bacterium]HJO85602.1 50S ribosomal protein L23 [Rhodospirillales bacterium]|tara:strand:+ start:122 stop:451 length:330 start_codon:yes stop_codon:yes gene_type:complete
MSKHSHLGKNVKLSQERMYELIRSPIITEKSTIISEYNQVSFRVPLEATKPEIRAAVEGLFDVKVKAVNTIVQKGKVKRFRGHLGKRSDFKKAIVTLVDGDSIDITTGV